MSRPRPKPAKRFKRPAPLLPSEEEAFGQAKAAGSAYRSLPNGGVMIAADDRGELRHVVFDELTRFKPGMLDGLFIVDREPRLTLADVPGDGPREALAALEQDLKDRRAWLRQPEPSPALERAKDLVRLIGERKVRVVPPLPDPFDRIGTLADVGPRAGDDFVDDDWAKQGHPPIDPDAAKED